MERLEEVRASPENVFLLPPSLGGGLVAQSCLTLGQRRDCSPQAPLSMGFSKQEYWSGLSFPSPGDLAHPGIEPSFLHFRELLYHLSYKGSPYLPSASQGTTSGLQEPNKVGLKHQDSILELSLPGSLSNPLPVLSGLGKGGGEALPLESPYFLLLAWVTPCTG